MANIFTGIVSKYRIFGRAFGDYTKATVVLIALGFLGGLFEGIGANSIIPLFSILTNKTADGQQDTITRFLAQAFDFFHLEFSLASLLVLIVGLFVLRSITLVVSSLIKIQITTKYEKDIRVRLLKAFIKADWPFLIDQKLGHLETLLLTNVRNASLVLEHFCMVFVTVASLLVYLVVAFNISATITLLTMGVGAVVFIFFKPLLGGSKKFSYNIEIINKQIAHFLNESIYGLKTIKIMHVGATISKLGDKYFESLRKESVKIAMLRSVGDALLQPIGVIFICVLFAISYKATAFQIGSFAAVIYLVQRIFIFLQQALASMRAINEYSPYLTAILRMEEDVAKSKEEDGGKDAFSFGRSLEFKNVSFGYQAEKLILDGVSFEVKKGETVGLIGPSGAGKTTVVDLCLRLFKPNEGVVAIDGKDVKTIKLEEWRDNIGYVSQDIFLMNDTIEANIRFYDEDVTEADMVEAAKKANIHEFIESLPNKYATVIGERGVLLSAGQRQRIIIARILARSPQILILDEATSALDNESEMQIQEVMENLKGKITVLIIAHRLTTIMHADRLMVLEGGKIIEEGRPDELLANKDSYFHKVSNIRK
ncbi:ABC transporter ATP-binding protein [Candidatus Uhrbacteria bacterium]|nr:ABC transporter ATP-binding protein [Candidatus Uhrbacteria bacterium]